MLNTKEHTPAISLWIGNLGKYNEGELIGEWVALPCDDFEAVFERIGINAQYEEYFVPDWECEIPGLEYSEYPDLDELNEIAETWETLYDDECRIIGARMDMLGESFAEALENKDDGRIWADCVNMSDVAYMYVDECDLLHDVPDNLRYYFDYEAFGRDLGIEGNFDYYDGDMIEVW